ncbi:hypothetical protein BATDEDRAFT_85397 [Lichtheimia corymbifera JMRC:FSU:9682]|uniref:GRIP domain-containing protein n=1 Tax=Lichtheimia corymbifera JMRC:FSU:9682 TaxID=1263082 RepID=A0A068SHN8_9FUNG|nr:hypothetical protein BATDEDRAFT_85397 [Lichtheimia corymbifera JMRC:FSU:9682]
MAASQPSSTSSSPIQPKTQIVNKDDPLGADVEANRSRVKSPTRSPSQRRTIAAHDLEKANFQLSEQVKDLKYQLTDKTNEIIRLQDNMAARTSEHDEKMKKMREIFAQATKNLDGYRASIAAKDAELQRLKDDISQAQVREQELRANTEAQDRDAENLASELNSQKALYGSQIKQLETKVRQLTSQLQETRTDYEQYKKRASQLLQKNAGSQSDSTRINELESTVRRLQMEKSELETEKAESSRKMELLEHDIQRALARIRDLEADNEALSKVREDNAHKQAQITRLQEQMASDKEAHEKAMKSIQHTHNETMQQLQELLDAKEQRKPSEDTSSPPQEPNTRQEEQEEMHRITEQLYDENASLRQQIMEKENELQDCKRKLLSLPASSSSQEQPQPSSQNQSSHNKESDETDGIDVYASMSHLLSPLVGGSENKVDLEKKVQHLSVMLHESEDRVSALRAQEKVLKDEIRKLDSFDRRQNLSIEYLKNVLLKFMQTENKEFMVPVLAKLLLLDANETETLRQSVIH